MKSIISEHDLEIRYQVYRHFAEKISWIEKFSNPAFIEAFPGPDVHIIGQLYGIGFLAIKDCQIIINGIAINACARNVCAYGTVKSSRIFFRTRYGISFSRVSELRQR